MTRMTAQEAVAILRDKQRIIESDEFDAIADLVLEQDRVIDQGGEAFGVGRTKERLYETGVRVIEAAAAWRDAIRTVDQDDPLFHTVSLDLRDAVDKWREEQRRDQLLTRLRQRLGKQAVGWNNLPPGANYSGDHVAGVLHGLSLAQRFIDELERGESE